MVCCCFAGWQFCFTAPPTRRLLLGSVSIQCSLSWLRAAGNGGNELGVGVGGQGPLREPEDCTVREVAASKSFSTEPENLAAAAGSNGVGSVPSL